MMEADKVDQLLAAVKEMRNAQRHYSQDRSDFNLMAVRASEKKVDDILVDLREGSRDDSHLG